MVLGDSTPDHQGARLLCVEDDVGKALLVLDHVHPEVRPAVREEPDLRADGAVHRAGDEDGDALLLRPVEQAPLVVHQLPQLRAELLGAQARPPGGVHFVEPGLDLLLYGWSIVVQGDEEVPEPVVAGLLEGRVVEVEAPVIVVAPVRARSWSSVPHVVTITSTIRCLIISTMTPRRPVAIGAAGKDRNLVQRLSATMSRCILATSARFLPMNPPPVVHLVDEVDHILRRLQPDIGDLLAASIGPWRLSRPVTASIFKVFCGTVSENPPPPAPGNEQAQVRGHHGGVAGG